MSVQHYQYLGGPLITKYVPDFAMLLVECYFHYFLSNHLHALHFLYQGTSMPKLKVYMQHVEVQLDAVM